MLELGETCAAVAVVAAMHPLVIRAVETLQERQIPVFALISPLSAAGQVPYVGLDNWKVGRTAAWATEHFCRTPGKLGILVGNHRYQCQEQNESGFRSYFREHAPGFTLLEPLSTFEESSVAEEMTEKLLREHPDLAGLFVSGHQLMDVTRQGLLDGATSFIMSMPLSRFATETIAGMIRAARASTPGAAYNTVLPFEIYTRENI
jgi:LacI family transcriptional regulator